MVRTSIINLGKKFTDFFCVVGGLGKKGRNLGVRVGECKGCFLNRIPQGQGTRAPDSVTRGLSGSPVKMRGKGELVFPRTKPNERWKLTVC